ncbi:histidine kinase-group I protein [Amylocarpus encephaloides]|uniref:histidine kinase n=1 Tax=Amylocarpus encephaloides TaxID=45428 RepID=A0A9P7YII5_9HELO|nr:histidine kinase-group I protein [Amylocarpus encephaloides]
MAPVEATLGALASSEAVSDNARARELYKYYQPNVPLEVEACSPSVPTLNELANHDEPPGNIPVESDITSSKVSSPDTALTAFCQLVAWRTGARRSMIGLIDAHTQYFVAESTRTVDLIDAAKHGPGDDLWMGCSHVSKAGKLCETTVESQQTTEGCYPSFIVNDLAKDERFNQLPFVIGPPHLRFYAGVPLVTKRGIAIGSLFIVDDHVRDGLSKDQIHFLGTMAVTVMKHLEMSREVEEHRRGMKMSRGLASFVEGRAELAEADLETEEGEGSKIAGRFEVESVVAPPRSPRSTKVSHRSSTNSLASHASTNRRERERSVAPQEGILDVTQMSTSPRPNLSESTNCESHASLGTATTADTWSPRHPRGGGESPSTELSDESTQRRLTSRAANLIRETFEVDGGCVFYDAQAGFAHEERGKGSQSDQMAREETSESQVTSGDDFNAPDDKPISGGPPATRTTLSRTSPRPYGNKFSRSATVGSTSNRKLVDILGFSTPDAASIHGDPTPGPRSFRPFQEKGLHALLRRYPRGKLWTFDSEGAVSSSSDDDVIAATRDPIRANAQLKRNQARTAKTKQDAKFLSRHFPGVRQLLFVPLWDAGRSRWLSGCFVWSTELTRILSKQSELSFLTAFGNSVMAEWSRIDTEIASQKKGDFIGSISHELRSPLHGILASTELLSEETRDSLQMDWLNTISSCGRTLLDTINHVLDFSKINNFERTWRKAQRNSMQSGAPLKQSDLSMNNLYAEVDISEICEEVVEGGYFGHTHQSVTTANFDMVRQVPEQMKNQSLSRSSFPQQEVTVIFDVDHQDYQFTTQPGAFRRVIMNLLGNALKYTSHGYVRVKLTSAPMADFHDSETGDVIPRSMVTLTVTDTGNGISPEFLRSKLFTPFAQENSLSSGTGLGLSIVKSIVYILEGDITIESEVGRGTQVRVDLPLLRGGLKHQEPASIHTPKSMPTFTNSLGENITRLRSLFEGQRVALHGFEARTQDPMAQKVIWLLEASIGNILTEFYGMLIVPLDQKPNVVVSHEGESASLSRLVRQSIRLWRTNPSVIVLCSHSSNYDRGSVASDTKLNIGFVNKPVGPLKLGKAIAQCLQGSRPLTPGLEVSVVSENDDVSPSFEEMTLKPMIGEVLDNSCMAADSDNARKVMESPTPNAPVEKSVEFPFPTIDEGLPPVSSSSKVASKPVQEETVPAGEPSTNLTLHAHSINLNGEPLPGSPAPAKKASSFLLVDDNAINLRLLNTSISKRNHEAIEQAMDGLAAVNKFQGRPHGYDVVFMDISMPLLDGFGATKEIRAIEESRKFNLAAKQGGNGAPFTPALIIALTGLASSDDQARAAEVGVDLFLTKPVSFKVVKKMLDNWEANREKESN